MELASVRQFLYKIDLFQSLGDTEIDHIAENVKERLYGDSDVIFNEGDEAHSMYIICRGEVSVCKGNRELARFLVGSFIGEMGMLDSRIRSASAIAVGETQLLEISESVFRSTVGSKSKSLLYILKTLSERIRDDNRKLEEDYLQLSTFVHDLNNSLQALSYAAIIRQNSEGDQKMLDLADRILDAQQFIKAMTEEALRTCKTPSMGCTFDSHDILDVIRETVDLHLAMHDDVKSHVITIESEDDLPCCPHNKKFMVRVLTNLILNACQASPENSEIKIDVTASERYLIIDITDYGCGIDDKLQDLIFQPRFTTKANGNGLGLISCKNIVEKQHFGSLKVRSEKDKGTTCKISLPLNRSSATFSESCQNVDFVTGD